jgi:hypothetical protein
MSQRKIAAALSKCKNASGNIDPAILVEQAEDKNHELHDRFEWDDSKAAHMQRIETARQLIKSLKHIVTYEEKRIVVPYYVSDPRTKKVGYTPAITIKKNRDSAMAVLNDELARIRGAIHRAVGLAAVFGLKSEFDDLLNEVVDIETKLQTWPESAEG